MTPARPQNAFPESPAREDTVGWIQFYRQVWRHFQDMTEPDRLGRQWALRMTNSTVEPCWLHTHGSLWGFSVMQKQAVQQGLPPVRLAASKSFSQQVFQTESPAGGIFSSASQRTKPFPGESGSPSVSPREKASCPADDSWQMDLF
ncbi:hypothetical protein HER14_06065 [Acidithiobacillus thiooxidans]|uniref:hypothetical protein n=1 Tax=Acidithiobacillus thiooxidans TaxID=930 RepID=UPI001C078DB0|nr:hypothetical protein [Acidithiobacillus thiooxidans]MBU2750515.1 hypothetical protein [Acidithiobacillus thiooxidans]